MSHIVASCTQISKEHLKSLWSKGEDDSSNSQCTIMPHYSSSFKFTWSDLNSYVVASGRAVVSRWCGCHAKSEDNLIDLGFARVQSRRHTCQSDSNKVYLEVVKNAQPLGLVTKASTSPPCMHALLRGGKAACDWSSTGGSGAHGRCSLALQGTDERAERRSVPAGGPQHRRRPQRGVGHTNAVTNRDATCKTELGTVAL
ncbi:hypothetical protein BJV74DRAFT_833218 [Russula compacta]|nr:hypothetical protein BJV74DRAFT_833218 [Russula compacta]